MLGIGSSVIRNGSVGTHDCTGVADLFSINAFSILIRAQGSCLRFGCLALRRLEFPQGQTLSDHIGSIYRKCLKCGHALVGLQRKHLSQRTVVKKLLPLLKLALFGLWLQIHSAMLS